MSGKVEHGHDLHHIINHGRLKDEHILRPIEVKTSPYISSVQDIPGLVKSYVKKIGIQILIS